MTKAIRLSNFATLQIQSFINSAVTRLKHYNSTRFLPLDPPALCLKDSIVNKVMLGALLIRQKLVPRQKLKRDFCIAIISERSENRTRKNRPAAGENLGV